MKKIRLTPLSPNGDMPVDFYSWGDHAESGLISRRSQVEGQLQEAFDSIEIKEDEETPELDYILKVLGKEAGRVIIPFDMVVKDAYYDKVKKEIVIVIQVGQGELREIRIEVEDLVDVYTGDNITVKVEDNVISLTEGVMQKFYDLKEEEDKIKEELANKSEIGHKHEISDVNALQETLDNKMNKNDMSPITSEQIYQLFE